MGTNEFSVWQFLSDGTQERVRHLVSAEEAVKAAHHYTHNVAVRMGITLRVIITDGGDFCVFEWLKDKGIVFPEPIKHECTYPDCESWAKTATYCHIDCRLLYETHKEQRKS